MRIKDQDKQQRIKEAMVSLILHEGIDGTSISKIAREAGVSQATIYVYYESKEEMLTEVFREYSKKSFQYLNRHIDMGMSAAELIDAIIRSSYAFCLDHEEIFSFVEQCSRSPMLQNCVCERDCGCDILNILHTLQAKNMMVPYDDWNVMAMLFAPVRFLAMNRDPMDPNEKERLTELIHMVQTVLLK